MACLIVPSLAHLAWFNGLLSIDVSISYNLLEEEVVYLIESAPHHVLNNHEIP